MINKETVALWTRRLRWKGGGGGADRGGVCRDENRDGDFRKKEGGWNGHERMSRRDDEQVEWSLLR